MTTLFLTEDEVKKMYSTNKEIANYYDSIRNIGKAIEYSFLVCKENPLDVDCVTKIVYWASFCHKYDDIIKLCGIVKDNKIQFNKLKEVFLKENKRSLKDLLVKYYLDIIVKQEEQNLHFNKVSVYLTEFYHAIQSTDCLEIYQMYLTEKSKLLVN